MWESLFEEGTQEAFAQGCHKLLNQNRIIIHIIIASTEEPICVSLDWTEAVVVYADVGLQKVLAIMQLPVKFTLHELVGADMVISLQLFESKQKVFRAQVASGYCQRQHSASLVPYSDSLKSQHTTAWHRCLGCLSAVLV